MQCRGQNFINSTNESPHMFMRHNKRNCQGCYLSIALHKDVIVYVCIIYLWVRPLETPEIQGGKHFGMYLNKNRQTGH